MNADDRATATGPRATIVMYHYVRRLAATPFPRLAALDLDAFAGQVEYILRHYSPVSAHDLVTAAAGREALPKRPILLTFDDGYAEHYREVFPVLRRHGVPGVFFPAAWSLLDRRVLDVNKIQFIVAAASSPDDLVDTIERTVERAAGQNGLRTVTEYRAAAWKPVRFDTAPVSYVKYMLQGVLPEPIRTELVDSLFARFVAPDERAFADALYFSVADAREMAAAGMTIGCHADRHLTLTTLDRAGQQREIDGALRVLDATGIGRLPLFFSYAKGAYNDDSLELLRGRGCALAVTNRPGIAMLTPDAMLALPRLDANHLPIAHDTAPNEWTLQA